MLTYHFVAEHWTDMFIETVGAIWTGPVLVVELALGSVWIEGKIVLFSKERFEVEVYIREVRR